MSEAKVGEKKAALSDIFREFSHRHIRGGIADESFGAGPCPLLLALHKVSGCIYALAGRLLGAGWAKGSFLHLSRSKINGLAT